MSKKDQPVYEHHVPKFLQTVLNRNFKCDEEDEKKRDARARIDREDLGEEAPLIVEEDKEALIEFQESEKRKNLLLEKKNRN